MTTDSLKFSLLDKVKVHNLDLKGSVAGIYITPENTVYDVRIKGRGIMTFSEAELELEDEILD